MVFYLHLLGEEATMRSLWLRVQWRRRRRERIVGWGRKKNKGED
jgi:hypothetical protein